MGNAICSVVKIEKDEVMNGIEDYIPDLAKLLGVEPSTALLIVGLLIALMNLGGRLIPDDATGWLGVVRKICKLVGLYASNRIRSKLTVNKIAEPTGIGRTTWRESAWQKV